MGVFGYTGLEDNIRAQGVASGYQYNYPTPQAAQYSLRTQGGAGAPPTVGAQPNQGQGQVPPGQDIQPGQMPPGQQQGSLPGTGLDYQLATLQGNYQRAAQAREIGFDPVAQGGYAANAAAAQNQDTVEDGTIGSSSLDQIARNLADRYGLAVGRDNLIDANGNWLITPDQLVEQSGGRETLGTAAAKMQYIENALTREQNREQQSKARGAISAGLENIQSRSRGSLAALQSGYYQDLADLYANEEDPTEDFSYFIQKEAQDIQRELQSRAERLLKKQGKMLAIMGVAELVGGLASGNGGMAVSGGGKIAAGGYGAGWW